MRVFTGAGAGASCRVVDAERELGLVYNIYSHLGPQGHKQVFKSHYSELKTSLIVVGSFKRAIFAVYKAIAKAYKALVR